VVARTRVIQPRQGIEKNAHLVSQALATSQPHELSCSNVRICIASQQAEGYKAGYYDACSELASHDAFVSLLIDHLTGGHMNVLGFVALQFDTAYRYRVVPSHQQRFGSD
jgi:hypothetical protein